MATSLLYSRWKMVCEKRSTESMVFIKLGNKVHNYSLLLAIFWSAHSMDHSLEVMEKESWMAVKRSNKSHDNGKMADGAHSYYGEQTFWRLLSLLFIINSSYSDSMIMLILHPLWQHWECNTENVRVTLEISQLCVKLFLLDRSVCVLITVKYILNLCTE